MVTDKAIERVIPHLSVHYRGSFSGTNDKVATMLEYKRCLTRMEWCDDQTFEDAVDWVVDHVHTNGFLPEWSIIRDRCWAIEKEKRARQQAQEAIDEVRRRAQLPPPQSDIQDTAFRLITE